MNGFLMLWPSLLLLTGMMYAGCSESDSGDVDNGEDVKRIVVETDAPTTPIDTVQSGDIATADEPEKPGSAKRNGENDTPDRKTPATDDDGKEDVDLPPSAGEPTAETPKPTSTGSTVGLVTGVSGNRLPAIGEVDFSMVSLPAPGFTWKNVDGTTGSLKDYRGSVVLLNFWGTWCPPCRRELPDIVAIRKEFRPKGFEVIGVAVNERPVNGRSIPQNLAAFAKANNLDYPLVIDDARISDNYGQPPSVPTTFVIDRKGRVTGVLIGARTADEFRKAIVPYL